MLKTYGDDEVTVSIWRLTVDPVTVGKGFTGAFNTLYLNSVVPDESVVRTSLTTYSPL